MECALRVQGSSASKMYNAAALFLNHTPATAEHHYALNPDIILQAQQAVCVEYKKIYLAQMKNCLTALDILWGELSREHERT